MRDGGGLGRGGFLLEVLAVVSRCGCLFVYLEIGVKGKGVTDKEGDKIGLTQVTEKDERSTHHIWPGQGFLEGQRDQRRRPRSG